MKKLLVFLGMLALAGIARSQTIAVDPATYAPNFTAGRGVGLAVDKDTGALLVEVTSGGVGGTGDASAANQALQLAQETAIVAKLGPVAADPGTSRFRTTALTSTAQAIKASGGNVYSVTLFNPNTAPVYVKFYNIAAASVTVGTSTVQHVIMVPPGDGTTPGAVLLPAGLASLHYFGTAIAAACVTGLADNSTSAPSTAIYAEVEYK